MADAHRDQNNVTTLTGVLNSTGASIVNVLADPTTHVLSIDDNTTGSDFGPANALRDQNDVPTLLAVSEVDGVTPVVIYTTSDGKLLIDSN